MNDQEYNGWTNYETWNCNLWMGEDSAYWDDICQECFDRAGGCDFDDRKENGWIDFSGCIKATFQEQLDEAMGVVPYGFFRDLMQAALDAVNFEEIAKAWMEGIAVDEPTEDEDEPEEDEGDEEPDSDV